MEIFGLEKLSLVDYDGYVCATVFTGSCNFRCPFCHNSALVLDYKTLPPLENDDLFSYLKKRKGLLEAVCITGGEPTLNKDLPQFAEQIKNLGYKVKLDTNGTNPEMVKSLFSNGIIDYFAMDIKNDKENYANIIGFDSYDTKKVEQTVDFFLTSNCNYEFRTTLIKEFHNRENIIKIGEWIKGAKKYFLQKFKNGDNCITQTLNSIETEFAKEFLEILKKYIPNTSLRGYDI